ncbi:uncharacterized protein LOC113339452 [Papaver somniferum]|uniref:uncharacterized protein LOC113339452 n=1 Tax=Papaver somniferum TaxID=3469 RepID=UPI000E705912|nr:uncharacterized protein LOC113339452 [Papaver somniferum]
MIDVDEDHGNPKDLLTDRNSNRWEILVDGSSNGEGNGIGIVFISPTGARMAYSFRLDFASKNNETEYEAVVHALKLAIEMKIEDARITSDSQLEIRQVEGTYSTNEPSLQKYKQLVMYLAARIPKISWRHIGRKDNRLSDALAFIPSMLIDPVARDIKIQTLFLPSIEKGETTQTDVMTIENMEEESVSEDKDWRTEIHLYIKKGEVPRKRLEAHKLKIRATNYELSEGVLYRRSFLGPSLRCLTRKEGIEILKALHYGDASNHSGGRSLAYRAKIQGYYWPYMHDDAKQVSRRCEECQRHGTRQKRYLIVATDYFTKWAEVKAVQHIRGKDIFTFIFENIICRVGIPAQLVSDNGKQFEGDNIEMTTRREATGMSPFCLTYGVEVVSPTEVIIPTTKKEAWEKNLSADLILAKLDDLEEAREVALQHMENYQQRLDREYNKRVKIREFQPGELVLREIPIYQRGGDGKLEKKWDGPYIIKRIVGNGAYELMDP